MRNKRIPSCALVMGLMLAGCSAQGTRTLSVESKMPELRPVVVQGAMPVEAEKLASRLDNVSVRKSAAGRSGV
jgi:adenosylhomocysteine nucleosidase